MKDLSLHILDIAQNSVRAGAKNISIAMEENETENFIKFSINDDGCGMDEKTVQHVKDPFYTTRTTRNVGLGLALLDQMTTSCDGFLEIKSATGKGTNITAQFKLNHIDTPSIGDIPATITTLFAGTNQKNVQFSYIKNKHTFSVSTSEINEVLDGVSLNHPVVLKQIRELITDNINNL